MSQRDNVTMVTHKNGYIDMLFTYIHEHVCAYLIYNGICDKTARESCWRHRKNKEIYMNCKKSGGNENNWRVSKVSSSLLFFHIHNLSYPINIQCFAVGDVCSFFTENKTFFWVNILTCITKPSFVQLFEIIKFSPPSVCIYTFPQILVWITQWCLLQRRINKYISILCLFCFIFPSN